MPKHHNHYNFLAEMFPTQFSTIPSIIIWTLVYILDAALVIWAAWLLDFPLVGGGLHSRLVLIICMVIAFALFCLESFLYNLIKH